MRCILLLCNDLCGIVRRGNWPMDTTKWRSQRLLWGICGLLLSRNLGGFWMVIRGETVVIGVVGLACAGAIIR